MDLLHNTFHGVLKAFAIILQRVIDFFQKIRGVLEVQIVFLPPHHWALMHLCQL